LYNYQPADNRTQIVSWIEAQHRYINNLHVDDIRLITSYESMDSYRWNNVLRVEKNLVTENIMKL
jgi:hypothetical protein